MSSPSGCKRPTALPDRLRPAEGRPAEPCRDVWPPTYRTAAGTIVVDATFKEPARQKLLDRSTRVLAVIALAAILIGRDHGPWPALVNLVLAQLAGPGAPPSRPELAAAWLLIILASTGTIVGCGRLLLAALGLDRGRLVVRFGPDGSASKAVASLAPGCTASSLRPIRAPNTRRTKRSGSAKRPTSTIAMPTG